MNDGDLITFMEYMWLSINDDIITIGISEKVFEDFDEINKAILPEESAFLMSDQVCGELETDQGHINLYSPVDGEVIEINEAILQNPKLIQEDCIGDGWLLKIQTDNFSQIENLVNANKDVADIDPEYNDDE